jgi:hypothetical protein
MFPGTFEHLHLMALDPYDLALSKLERNIQRDRDDVRHLARTVPFDLDALQERYQTELRWQMAIPKREDVEAVDRRDPRRARVRLTHVFQTTPPASE